MIEGTVEQHSASMQYPPFNGKLYVLDLGAYNPKPDITPHEVALLIGFFTCLGARRRPLTDPDSYSTWLKERGLDRHFDIATDERD